MVGEDVFAKMELKEREQKSPPWNTVGLAETSPDND